MKRQRRKLRPPAERVPGEVQCRAKQVWRTEQQATNAMVRLRKAMDRYGKTFTPVRPYRCPVCGLWHLTSRPG